MAARQYLEVIPRDTFISSSDGRTIRNLVSATSTAESRMISGAKAELKRTKKCLICKQMYSVGDNFVVRECAVHTMYVTGNFYPCCGKQWGSVGCVSCIHIAEPDKLAYFREDPITAVVELPKSLVDTGVIPCSTEMLDNYPDGSVALARGPKIMGGLFYRLHYLAL